MSHRVFKKIATPFELSDPSGAILIINLYDPQVNTVKVFREAIEEKGIPYLIIGNKIDLVGTYRKQIVQEYIGNFVETCLIKNEGINEVKNRIKEMFPPGSRILVLGVFNCGKSSLIKALTGIEDIATGDIPGTTLEFIEYSYDEYCLIDTVGQVIDINKPLMVSIDFTSCETIEDRISKVFEADVSGITQSHHKDSIESIKRAVLLIKKQIEKGHKIITVGAGGSSLVAREIAGQGMETGLPILVFTNDFADSQPVSFAKGTGEQEGGLARYISNAINPGDCCIGVSVSGGTYFVFKVLELARNKGAHTIAITENIDTPLGKNADIIIQSSAKIEGPSSSRCQVAHLVIGHAIILALAAERGITAEESIQFMLPETGDLNENGLPILGIPKTKKMGIK